MSARSEPNEASPLCCLARAVPPTVRGVSDSSKPGRANGDATGPSSAPPSLFNTLPPAPLDPATTVRAPSMPKSAGEAMAIIMPPLSAAPVIAVTTHGISAESDRDALLARLRERRAKLTAAHVASLLKLLE